VSQSEFPELTNVARYNSPFELFLTWPLLNGPSFIVHSLYRDPPGTAIGIQNNFHIPDFIIESLSKGEVA
jgi:hypothetical protein